MSLYGFAASRGITVEEVVDGFIKNFEFTQWAFRQLDDRKNGQKCDNCGSGLYLMRRDHTNPKFLEFQCRRSANAFDDMYGQCPLVGVDVRGVENPVVTE